jgi:hypothetical protein
MACRKAAREAGRYPAQERRTFGFKAGPDGDSGSNLVITRVRA